MELIITYGAEGAIQAWTLRGGTVVRTWRGLSANVMSSSNACVMQPVTDRMDTHPMLAVDNKILAWNWDSSTPALTHNSQESIATRSVVTMSAEHALKVTALHASPLGRYIVAGFDDGSVRAWSVVDGALVLTLVGAHRRAVQCIRMSPRERWLATGGADATVHVWDWSRALCSQNESARHVTLSAHRLAVTGVTWSGESKLLSISTDGTCRVWDMLSRHVIFAATFSTPLTALAVSPTGHCAYLGGEDGVIYRLGLWDPPARDFQIETSRDDNCYRGHKQRVTSLTTSLDGSHVISTSADHTCLVWYENSFQIAHSFTRHMGPVVHAAVVLKLDAREEEHRHKKRAGLKMLGKISKEDESANDMNQQVTHRVMSLSDTKRELIDTLWHQDNSTVLATTDLDTEPVTWSEELFHERVRAVRRPAATATQGDASSSDHVTAENSRLREEVKQLKELNRKWKHVSQELWSHYADTVSHNL